MSVAKEVVSANVVSIIQLQLDGQHRVDVYHSSFKYVVKYWVQCLGNLGAKNKLQFSLNRQYEQ